MSKIFRIVTILYLIFIGTIFGAGVFAGVVVAPVIFNTNLFLGDDILTHFQEGQIMTEIFLRLSYLLIITIIVVILYEGYKFKKFERDRTTQIATFFVLATGILFSEYYIPDIIEMQLVGEEITKSIIFINTHKGSEINFKIFLLALLVLIIKNMQKACR